MKLQWLNHTGFVVSDMERSLAFYRDMLGSAFIVCASNRLRNTTLHGHDNPASAKQQWTKVMHNRSG